MLIMKKKMMKLTAFILALILSGLLTGIAAAGAPGGFEDAEEVFLGEVKEVTVTGGDFSSIYGIFICFKRFVFNAEMTGIYTVSLNGTSPFRGMNVYDSEGEYIDKNGGYVYFETYETYYIEFFMYSMSSVVPGGFDVNFCIEYLGELESVEIVQLPEKLTYISGYDAYSLEDAYAQWGYGLTLEEYLERYPSEVNGYISIALYGLKIEIRLTDAEPVYIESGYPSAKLKEPLVIGQNTVTLEYLGGTLEFDITVIENPVKSIEVRNLPSIGPFKVSLLSATVNLALGGYSSNAELDKFFGYNNIPPKGSELVINYTDGTSKVIVVDENFVRYIDGYHVSHYYRQTESGYEFNVEYLGSSTKYFVEVEYVGTMKTLMNYADIVVKILDILMSLLDKFFRLIY